MDDNGSQAAANGNESILQDCVLLIDWENFKYSLLNQGQTPSLSTLREIAERHGRIVLARAYADWQEHRDDPGSLYAAGIEPVYVPTTFHGAEDGGIRRWKNSIDVKLTADCIELAYRFPQVRTFVLVSGDQDFLHVVNTLRPTGRRVVTIGLSWSTSPRLAERVDEVVLYDQVAAPKAPEATETSTPLDQKDRVAIAVAIERLEAYGELEEWQTQAWERGLKHMLHFVRGARAASEHVLLSNVGADLRSRVPDLEYRRVFKGRLKEAGQALEFAGLVKVLTRGLVDWVYLPTEDIKEQDEVPADSPDSSTRSLTWEDLDASEQTQALTAIRSFRAQPGISYITFNQIKEQVGRVLPWLGEPQLFRLVNDMIDRGIVVKKEDRTGFSPLTGGSYTFSAFELGPAANL